MRRRTLRAIYRLNRIRVRHRIIALAGDMQEVFRFLLRGGIAALGATIVLAVGLAVITASFTQGFVVICIATVWGIAAWLISTELQKRKPHPTQSTKPRKREQFKIAYRSYLFWKLSIPALMALVPVGFLIGYLWPRQSAQPAVPAAPPLNPVALSIPVIGCEWNQIPIAIASAMTIHVIRLYPPVLRGNPQFSSVGVFEDISSRSDRRREWPSKTDGRW